MPKNTGTLVTAAIRPNASEDLIASALSNEIMGGHHQYATLTLRNAIIEERREWGMLCTVYNDGDNNGTYQLVYGASDTNIKNNNNWVPFSGGGGSVTSGEWVSSVISILQSPPGTTPSDGSRYLIGTPSSGTFATQSNKIAVWNGSGGGGFGEWVFTEPTTGQTLRVDNQLNVIYKYNGTWSLNNQWKREYVNQIRYIQPTSTNGSTYSFTSSTSLTPLDAYSYSVYYAKFGMTNSGPSTLQIDGLGYFSIKKASTSGLTDLSSQDLIPNVQYNLSWNEGNFMLHGLGGGGGGSSGVIGEPEDSSYGDGLYTDFTPSTPIGVAIDRFNEILKGLVPPKAPDLSSWSLGGPTFVTDGKLSFDSSIAGFSAAPGFGINSLYSATTYRKGIMSGVSQPNVTNDIYYQDITGTLNDGVAATLAYGTNAFGNGTTGSLLLKLNGVTISNVDLSTNLSGINQTGAGGSGFILSAATNSKFDSGIPFPLFWWRTGTYVIRKNNVNLKNGYNYLELSHVLPSSTLSLSNYTWVMDRISTAASFVETNTSITTDSSENGTKILSGIKFYKTVSIGYQVVYSGHVNSTYNSGNAISAQTLAVSSTNNPITNSLTITSPTILSPDSTLSPSPIPIPTITSPSSTLTKIWTLTLNTNVRRMNEPVTIRTSVLRTVQGTNPSPGLTITNLLIDNYTLDLPTDTTESFETEEYRVSNGSTKYATGVTDTVSQVLTNKYTSTNSSTSLLVGAFRNQLQFINGCLVYPKYNFSNFGDASKNPNFGNPNANYSQATTSGQGHNTTNGGALTNNRTFTRVFRLDTNNTYAKVRFSISGTLYSFVSCDTGLSGNNLWIEAKLPYDTTRPQPAGGLIDGGVTGWMDMTKNFDGAPVSGTPYSNGAGARAGAASTTLIPIQFGERNTFSSNGYVLLRITASPDWAGNITNISISPN